jgi:hypothetical protein
VRTREFDFLHNVQRDTGAHAASYSKDIKRSFPFGLSTRNMAKMQNFVVIGPYDKCMVVGFY